MQVEFHPMTAACSKMVTADLYTSVLDSLQESNTYCMKTAHWSTWKLDGPVSFDSTEGTCKLNFTGACSKMGTAGLQIYKTHSIWTYTENTSLVRGISCIWKVDGPMIFR